MISTLLDWMLKNSVTPFSRLLGLTSRSMIASTWPTV